MKPILFNTEMVKAILDGRKTVTRRICKDVNERIVPLNDFIDNEKRTYAIQCYEDLYHMQPVSLCEVSMPICKGDILYVTETWKVENTYPSKFGFDVLYRADEKILSCIFQDMDRYFKFSKFEYKNGWQSPYFMPKEAARIFLKVTDVRVEKLQDINGQGHHDDIWKEGITSCRGKECSDWMWCTKEIGWKNCFKSLWNSTIKKSDINSYGWNTNPWVWVIEFERISKEDAYAENI